MNFKKKESKEMKEYSGNFKEQFNEIMYDVRCQSIAAGYKDAMDIVSGMITAYGKKNPVNDFSDPTMAALVNVFNTLRVHRP
jgi:hypothetical protein